MSALQVVGAVMVLAFFGGLTFMIAVSEGWRTAGGIMLFAFAVTAFVVVATGLLSGELA